MGDNLSLKNETINSALKFIPDGFLCSAQCLATKSIVSGLTYLYVCVTNTHREREEQSYRHKEASSVHKKVEMEYGTVRVLTWTQWCYEAEALACIAENS